MTRQPAAAPRLASVHASIERYYSAKIARHGPTPRGVDWSSVLTQQVRFLQLLKICAFAKPFSLNDVGCGYGALLAYLAERHTAAAVDYLGIDLSAAMIRQARKSWRGAARAEFVVGNASPRVADYSIASGIFNVQLDQPSDRWEAFIASTLSEMSRTSRRGFAVNFIAADPRRPNRPGLYRTLPGQWIRHCEETLGLEARLIAGYGLGEFTLLLSRRKSVRRTR